MQVWYIELLIMYGFSTLTPKSAILTHPHRMTDLNLLVIHSFYANIGILQSLWFRIVM